MKSGLQLFKRLVSDGQKYLNEQVFTLGTGPPAACRSLGPRLSLACVWSYSGLVHGQQAVEEFAHVLGAQQWTRREVHRGAH